MWGKLGEWRNREMENYNQYTLCEEFFYIKSFREKHSLLQNLSGRNVDFLPNPFLDIIFKELCSSLIMCSKF